VATSTTLSHHHFPYFASSAGTTLNPQANKAKLLYFQCYFLNYLWYSQPPRIECWVGTTHCQLDKGQDNGVEFCGGGSPGCPEVIARYARTGEPLAYIEPSTPKRRKPRCSRQLAFSSPSSVQLAFFVTDPPPLPLSRRPHCQLGI